MPHRPCVWQLRPEPLFQEISLQQQKPQLSLLFSAERQRSRVSPNMQQREYRRLSSSHQQRTSADEQRRSSSRREATTPEEGPFASKPEYEGRPLTLPSPEQQLLPHRSDSHISQEQRQSSFGRVPQPSLGRLSSVEQRRLHVLPSVPEQQHHITRHASTLQQHWPQEASYPAHLLPQRHMSLPGVQRPSPPTAFKHLATAASLHLRQQQLSPDALLEREQQQEGQRQTARRTYSLLAPGLYDTNRARSYIPTTGTGASSGVAVMPTATDAARRSSTREVLRQQEMQQRGEELLRQQGRLSPQQTRTLHRRDLEERDAYRRGHTVPAVFLDSEEVSGRGSEVQKAGDKLLSPQLLPYRHASAAAALPYRDVRQRRMDHPLLRRHTLATVAFPPTAAASAALASPSAAADYYVTATGSNGTRPAAAPAGSPLSSRPSTSTQRSLQSFLQRLKAPRASAPAVSFPLQRREKSSSSIEDAERRAIAGGDTRGLLFWNDPAGRTRRARTIAVGAENSRDLLQRPSIAEEPKGMLAAMKDALRAARLKRHDTRPLTAHTEVLRSGAIRCQSEFPAVVIAFTLPAVAAAFAPLCPEELPHALLPLCGVPLLFFTLNFLQRAGVTEILLLVKDDWEGRAIQAEAAAYEHSFTAEAKAKRVRESHRRSHQRQLLPEHEGNVDQQQQQQQYQKYGKDLLEQRQGSNAFAAALPRIEVVRLPLSTSSVGDALRALDSRADIRTDFLLMLMGTVVAADLQLAMAEHRERGRFFAAAGADTAAAGDGSAQILGQRRSSMATVAAALYAAGASARSAVLEARASTEAAAAAAGRRGAREQLLTQIFARTTPSSPLRVKEDDAAFLLDASTQEVVAVKNLSSSHSLHGADLDAHELFGVESLDFLCEDEVIATVAAGRQLQLHYDLVDVGLYLCSPKVLTSFSCCFDYSSMAEDFIPAAVRQASLSKRNAAVYAHILETGDMKCGTCSFPFAARVVDPRTLFWTCRSLLERWAYPLVPEMFPSFFNLPKYKPIVTYGRAAYRAATVRATGPSSQLAPLVFIGDKTRIHSNASVRSSIIGARCNIHSGAFVEDSILFDEVVLEEGVRVLQSLVAANCIIKRAAAIYRGCLLCHCVVVNERVEVPPFTRLYSGALLQQLQQQQERQQQQQRKQPPEEPQFLLQQVCRAVVRSQRNTVLTLEMPLDKDWVAANSVGGSIAPLLELPLPRLHERFSTVIAAVQPEDQRYNSRSSTSLEFTGV